MDALISGQLGESKAMRAVVLLCCVSLTICGADSNVGATARVATRDVSVRGEVSNPLVGLGGNVGFFIDATAKTVRLKAAIVQNNQSFVSGPVRLRLFLGASPFTLPSTPGFIIAETALGTINPGAQIRDIDVTVPLFLPPNGTYFSAFLIEEGGRTTAVRDYFNFTGKLQALDGKFLSLGLPFFDSAVDSYSGRVGAPLSYAFNVYGALDITVSTSALPAGLTLDHTTETINNIQAFYIAGRPTAAGPTKVTITAANSAGSVTKDVNFTIVDATADAPPNIVCASALPNATNPGTPVAFNAYALDPENQNVSYTWDFKDGSPTLGGPSVSHTFTSAGTFNVLLTVSDGAQTTQQMLPVNISGPASVNPVVVAILTPKNPITVNELATLTVNATDPNNATLQCTWDFGDGSAGAVGGTVTHTYAQPGAYPIGLTAKNSNGVSTTRGDFVLYVLSGTGDPGINKGTESSSPEGLRIAIMSSENGVVQFGLTAVDGKGRAVPRDGLDFFGNSSILGRTGIIVTGGDTPVVNFRSSGIGIFSATVSKNGAFVNKRAGRKMVILGSKETGEAIDVPDTLSTDQKKVQTKKLAGSFNFMTGDVDVVTLSCKVQLPADFDLTKPHILSVGMGNVTDRILEAKAGKFEGTSERGLISKLNVKLPKSTNGKRPGFAQIDVEFRAPNLDSAGFESDGINADSLAAGQTTPTVQLGVVYGGVPYNGTAKVLMKGNKKTQGTTIKLTR